MILNFPTALLVGGNSFWRYTLKATLAIEIPSWILTGILVLLLSVRGGQSHFLQDPLPFATWSIPALVLAGPVLESFALAGGASLLSRMVTGHYKIAALSGLLWGALHARDFGLSLLCPAWGFFIMTLAYLAWRPKSFLHGYLAAMIPHLVHDLQWIIHSRL